MRSLRFIGASPQVPAWSALIIRWGGAAVRIVDRHAVTPHAALHPALALRRRRLDKAGSGLATRQLPEILIAEIRQPAIGVAVLVRNLEEAAAREKEEDRERNGVFHGAFHGMTLRSSSRNSVEVMTPSSPMVTMPTNMASTWSNSQEDQIR